MSADTSRTAEEPAASKPRSATAAADEGRIRVRDLLGPRDRHAELARDVREGLSKPHKEIPPKYFYDARGSDLFERITCLPEYYLTRTETEILERCAADIVADLSPHVLVEYGSGSSRKTRLLLDAMHRRRLLAGYAPVDVSEEALRGAAARLMAEYPELTVTLVIADFDAPVDLSFAGRPRLVAFLGSTIGNFAPEPAGQFVESIAAQLDHGDGFLVGFDLVKDVRELEAAYNDADGITARFNNNVLRVLNRELGADFDPESFRHLAFYDAERTRIEMHLVSERDQVVVLGDLSMEVEFQEGESIRTELSHKFTREAAECVMARGGLRLRRWETDRAERFALALAERG